MSHKIDTSIAVATIEARMNAQIALRKNAVRSQNGMAMPERVTPLS